jgi:bifunctional non-homologous end joining protein LigD
MESITLYYREGSSDKVYQAGITQKDGGHVVTFAYGRRGATLNTGTKTPSPVDYPTAKGIYDRLVREKTAKGYTPGENGTPYQHPDNAKQSSGILPQLLNAIDHAQAALLVKDPQWVMQEKFDGRRLLVRHSAKGTEGINRSGLIVSLPEPVLCAVASLPGSFILDGECVGERFITFDLLELSGTDLRPLPYHDRLLRLAALVEREQPHLAMAITASTTRLKTALLKGLRKENKEGVVFKHSAAPYRPGRPASGGDALKLKFHETASFIVTKVNEKRSVMLVLFNGDKIVNAGNVTIPPNQPMPSPGVVVECRYLYAFRESGCIYQPVYLGTRDDVPAEHCTTAQLKYKPTATAEATA